VGRVKIYRGGRSGGEHSESVKGKGGKVELHVRKKGRVAGRWSKYPKISGGVWAGGQFREGARGMREKNSRADEDRKTKG